MEVTRKQLINTDGSIVNTEHLLKSNFMEVENDQSIVAKPLENFHVDSQVSIPKVNLPENTLFVVNLIKILTSTDGIDMYQV